jgi:transcription elongation factor SPT6
LARAYKRRVDPQLEKPFRQAITHVLGFFNTDSLEVPFIWQHRRDFLYHPDRDVDEKSGNLVLKALRVLIDQDDLWKIWEEDGRYRAIQERLASLKSVWESLELHDRIVDDAMAEVSTVEDVQGICHRRRILT